MPVLTAEARITARDATGSAFNSVAAKMRGLQHVSEGVNGRIAASAMALGARVAALAGPAALVAGAVDSAKTFATLERGMTRIGITADASVAATKAATLEVQKLAQDTAMPVANVREGLDALVAQGRSLPASMALLPTIAKTAQAAGASVEDIAKSAGALGENFDVVAPKMQAAFDILNAGGKAGQFELKDMARYLPSLAAQAKIFGLRGEEGLRKFVAMSQTIRKVAGTSEETATALGDFFGKATSDETVKKFSKFGVQIRDTMDQARKSGKDLIEVYLDAVQKATGGDMNKINQLFSDKEIRRAVTGMMLGRDAMNELQKSLRDVDGSTMKDFARVMKDAQASIDQTAASWEKLKTTVGGKIAPAVTPVLDEINRNLNRDEPAGKTLYPNVSSASDVPPRAGTRSEAAAQEREDRFGTRRVNPALAGFSDARAAEREGFNPLEMEGARVAAAARNRARAAGGFTPAMAIERENEIDRQIRAMAPAIEAQVAAGLMTREQAIGTLAPKGTKLAEEKLKLEASRNGTGLPTAEQAAAEFRSVLEGAKPPPVEVKTSVDVKVEASDGLIATIVRKVSEQTGGGSGPGSTGRSMPETSAPAATGASTGRFGSN